MKFSYAYVLGIFKEEQIISHKLFEHSLDKTNTCNVNMIYF